MSAIFLIATVALFATAMLAYVVTMVHHKRPISFFELPSLARHGSRIAGAAYLLWLLAICASVLTGLSMVFSFFR